MTEGERQRGREGCPTIHMTDTSPTISHIENVNLSPEIHDSIPS